jgi:murein DD-endopeptidase MepM/ murein hydrolase activator NlpD
MSDCVAGKNGRSFPRLALAGLGLIFLSGCSSDVTRFSQSDSPFSNPFASNATTAAPTRGVTASPIAQSAPAAPAMRTASLSSPQAVGGSAAGWTAAGGSPIVVANGETLDTISGRYGVPASALLAANGLSGASEVRPGTRLVVPVYHADGRAIASTEKEKAAKKRESDVADAEPVKSEKSKAKDKEKEKGKDKATAKADKAAKDAEKSASKDTKESKNPKVAEVEPSKVPEVKKQAIDKTPTGNLEPATPQKTPLTGAQADAAGTEPEFRWPARGRIIQGFKSGGNDGINISVPAGTSVRAAESGTVVYSGDGLKGYGNLVLIKHPNGFVTAYGNNGELDVKRGDKVARGQVIAKSGDTGNVNSPQLHFELRKGSTPVDPTSYLAGL